MNRKWVTLHILWKVVSSHLFLWLIASEWHCTFCVMESHHMFPYDQQYVSDIAQFVQGRLITCFSMTNRLWVTLHIFWKELLSHLSLWPTASEWYCTFSERQSHHIFSYDQQRVSDIAHFLKASFIWSFPMTNSLWVILHILWKAVSWFITPLTMTNSKWVALHIFWKAISSYLFIWPTASEWHCIFCER